MPDANLLAALRQYWGYSSFRPLQERVVHSLVGGHDTCVVMPTGGGKSLCYQLPALVLGKTAVVISPLIALMQDQAAQLAQMGIPAAVLNSMISSAEQSRIMQQARAGNYRLLYLSPERLAREDTIGWMQGVPVSFFAIDEAHCISEWGHEFRPEYRQLSRLRATSLRARLRRSPPARRSEYGMTSCISCNCAVLTNTLPAFIARTCVTQ